MTACTSIVRTVNPRRVFFYRFFKEVSGARGGLAVTVRVLSDVLHLKRLGSARVRRVRFFMECYSRRRVRSVRRRRENVVVSSISVSCEYDALAAAYFFERRFVRVVSGTVVWVMMDRDKKMDHRF